MRKIQEFTGTAGTAKVYRDTEWQEFRVKFYTLTGEHLENADYHTTDKAEALEAAKAWAK